MSPKPRALLDGACEEDGGWQETTEREERAPEAGSTAAAGVYYGGGRRPTFGSWTNNERDSQLRERPNSGTLDVG